MTAEDELERKRALARERQRRYLATDEGRAKAAEYRQAKREEAKAAKRAARAARLDAAGVTGRPR